MKKLFIIPVALIVGFLFVNGFNRHKSNENETPKALTENKVDIYSSFSDGKRYNQSIISEIYSEQLDKDRELKELDASINELFKQRYALNSKLEGYQKNNGDYYSEATTLNTGIRDAELKSTIEKIIQASQVKYNQQMPPVIADFDKLREKHVSLEDYYTALKIIATLPGIEAYQKNEKSSQQAAKDLTGKIGEAIAKVDTKIKGQNP